jgi:hypothetical protein
MHAMADDHNRAIAQAAKAALAPLGFRRKGQSRTWLADHGWWLTVIEFQPSAWGKGSYLNVAPHWLWHPPANHDPQYYLSFDYGAVRFSPFVAMEPGTAFEGIGGLIDTAIRVAKDFEMELATVEALADATGRQADGRHPADWPGFHAGVAAGLAGRPARAKARFEALLATEALPNSGMHDAARALLALADQPQAFRSRVNDAVMLRRVGLKLPALAEAPL